MSPRAPEFHTEPTTPISPIPHYPPAPSKLPVLENQIDPVFNLTSSHTGSRAMAQPSDEMELSKPADSTSASDDNSFDPFGDQVALAKPAQTTSTQPTAGDGDDDYAMTFDNDMDGEAKTRESSNDITTATTEPTALSNATTDPNPSVSNTVTSPTNPGVPMAASAFASGSPTSNLPLSNASPTTVASASQSAPAQAPPRGYKPSTPPPIYQSIQKGEIDIQQLLDNITANAELKAANNGTAPPHVPATGSLPSRPPGVPETAMHPAYAPQNDIRAYHAGPSYPAPPGVARGPPGSAMPMMAPGARGTGLPPPPPASFVASPPAPGSYHRDSAPRPNYNGHSQRPVSSNGEGEREIRWSAALQKLFDAFLTEERQHVAEGVWDKFPVGSRLFIGNLVTERVSKKDVFYVFHKYGRIAQISIKQAYGFVQFHDVASCYAALDAEQDQDLRGRRMHLEISKPQQNTKKANQTQGQQTGQRRSNSPDRSRGHNRGQNNRMQQQGGRTNDYNRNDGRNGPMRRDDNYRQDPHYGGDGSRFTRSPSPQRGGPRGRDDYNRRNDHYNNRDHRRTRSRSPAYGHRGSDNYRQRSPSPRRPVDEDTSLGIPRRSAAEVPDVQILLLDELDRNFIQWVEAEIKKRGLKTEVMFLHPRLPVDLVIRRQILEGVTAVVRLTRRTQDASKIPLQVFDRSRGADNVRFDEYEDLEPRIAAELVVREKSKMAPVPRQQQPYGMPPQQYAPQPQYQQQQPAAAAPAPNLTNMLGQIDNNTLQQLLSTLNATQPAQQAPVSAPAPVPQQQNTASAQSNGQLDLAGILGMLKQQPQAQAQAQQPQYAPLQQQPAAQQNQQNAQYGAQNPAQAGPQGGGAQAQAGALDIKSIMANLAKFRQ